MPQPEGCFLIGATLTGWAETGKAFIASVSNASSDIRTFLRTIYPAHGMAQIVTGLVST